MGISQGYCYVDLIAFICNFILDTAWHCNSKGKSEKVLPEFYFQTKKAMEIILSGNER